MIGNLTFQTNSTGKRVNSARVLHIYMIKCDNICFPLLYPRHLCRRVYSFRLSVCPFVCSLVRSFVLPSRSWNLRQSFASKFLMWCISQQLLIRKHSYLDHSYPGGLAFTPLPWTPGSMPQGGARGQNLGHLKKCIF